MQPSSNMEKDLKEYLESQQQKIDSLKVDLESLEIAHSDCIELLRELYRWINGWETLEQEYGIEVCDVSHDEAEDMEQKLKSMLETLGEQI